MSAVSVKDAFSLLAVNSPGEIYHQVEKNDLPVTFSQLLISRSGAQVVGVGQCLLLCCSWIFNLHIPNSIWSIFPLMYKKRFLK